MASGSLTPAADLWHITLTVSGEPVDRAHVGAALERLVGEQPLLLIGRYGPDRAEVRYWEEAESVVDAASLALRLWAEHRESARLPDWRVVGLEVLDRETYHRRFDVSDRMARRGNVIPL